MSTGPLSANDIARFLQENPDFFHEHAHIFADLRVPHPHEARAISLGERQILTLRAKAKELDWSLATLRRNAASNEKINHTIINWCAAMLAEPDATRLPEHIVNSLSELFELPDITLRLWDIPALLGTAFDQNNDDTIREAAANLDTPWCGPASDHVAASWMGTPPASLAVMALRPQPEAPLFGLLILGSPEPERFTPDMGTDFLQTIAALAGASLSRLLQNTSADASHPNPASDTE